MDEPRKSDPALPEADSARGEDSPSPDRGRTVRTVLWALLSLAFVTYLALGSVDARIWRFGELHIESKSILRVWQVQGQLLPDVSNGWLLQLLFYGSALVFVACVILGMRYLLLEPDDESSVAATDRS